MKRIILCALLVMSCVLLFSCGDKNEETSTEETSTESSSMISYEQISQADAKAIMDTEDDYIIIDSRTQNEFDTGHIEGAIMIPEYEIKSSQDKLPSDKDTLILVYCRSGRRSKIAAQALVELGYTNVKEFGGIITWPYEIVQ
ncbi:MAG: rhodanese-like domain-containing protein [Clostridia bacterium]|nr:rhodanese-like domain-containing protein [Clostridia bacterium]